MKDEWQGVGERGEQEGRSSLQELLAWGVTGGGVEKSWQIL